MWTNQGLSLSYFKVEQLLVDRQGQKLILHFGNNFRQALQEGFIEYLRVLIPDIKRTRETDTLLKLLQSLYFLNEKETIGLRNGNYFSFLHPTTRRKYRWRYHGNHIFEKIEIKDNRAVSTIMPVENTLDPGSWIKDYLERLLFDPPGKDIRTIFVTKNSWRDILRATQDAVESSFMCVRRSDSKPNRYDCLNLSGKDRFACISEEGWYLTYC